MTEVRGTSTGARAGAGCLGPAEKSSRALAADSVEEQSLRKLLIAETEEEEVRPGRELGREGRSLVVVEPVPNGMSAGGSIIPSCLSVVQISMTAGSCTSMTVTGSSSSFSNAPPPPA